MKKLLFALLLCLACLSTLSNLSESYGLRELAYADGESEQTINAKRNDRDGTVQRESAASFDKRLPPVIPGEEIKTGGGKVKVWSTSGQVPVYKAPEPWQRHTHRVDGLDDQPIEVIVDQREKPARNK